MKKSQQSPRTDLTELPCGRGNNLPCGYVLIIANIDV